MPAQNRQRTSSEWRVIRNAGVTLSTTLNLITLRGGPTDGCGNRKSYPVRAIMCVATAGTGVLRVRKAGSFATTASATEIITLINGVEYPGQFAKIIGGSTHSQFSEIILYW